MLNEIGSNFWIKPQDAIIGGSLGTPEMFGIKGNDYAWMSTGRSATALVLDTIEARNPQITKVAVLPPFTCHTVIEPFLHKGYEVVTYHVEKNLMTNAKDILRTVVENNAGVVLIHRFFGFNTIPDIDSIIPELRSKGVVVIEDSTQIIYSSYDKADTDYFVGSIRKWCGVPDGGFAVCKDGEFENKPSSFDQKLQESKKVASLEKYDFLFNGKGDKQTFLNHYREAEDLLDNQNCYYSISELSSIIQSNLDVEGMKVARRRNFNIISKGLADVCGIEVIFKDMQDGDVPLYCPILCESRSDIQQLLVKNAIYAPVVWPKADCCPTVDADSKYIYNHILCIPIDQRYGADDMQRVVNVICNK